MTSIISDVELPLHRRQFAAAARTRLVGVIELEDLLDDRQLRLLSVAELLARLLRLLLAAAERLDLRGHLLRLPRELLDQRELLLQLLVVALQRAEPAACAESTRSSCLDLHLLGECDAAELLDVCLAPQIHELHSMHERARVDPLERPFRISRAKRRRHDDGGRACGGRRARSPR
ncbi:MAG: hypothetical protein U0270_17725 [Labilithrix sp.]